jgi:glycosyltransferase involved in cell wall biosynthesis
MNPVFSIITVTKDSGALFALTSDSIGSLACQDFEWIVVDGSIEHSSLRIVDQCTEDRALLIRGQDQGIAHAFNLGIEASRGIFVLILNAGDTYSSDFLDVCLDHGSESSILCGSVELVSQDWKSAGLFTPKPKALWRGMHLPHNWMCVPRCIYVEIGLYREISHAMDYEWCKRVLVAYGIRIFRCAPRSKPYGTYLLGGHSDKYYFAGLSASKRINIEYGMSPLLAELVYIAYSVKHLLFVG